jgi:hypothetical protein
MCRAEQEVGVDDDGAAPPAGQRLVLRVDRQQSKPGANVIIFKNGEL